jgi:hypothetical protein
MIKYFHELTDEEFEKLKKTGVHWNDLPKNYPQPKWCMYSDALNAEMGCWSLVYRMGVNKEYCSKDCDLFNQKYK